MSDVPFGPGHNNGPSMEPGHGFRRFAWGKARAALLPQLPLNVIRRRVARAHEIGLDYRTYATVRATTGRDIIGFLFSSNALRLHLATHRMAEDRARHLVQVRGCDRIALLHPPHAAIPKDEPLDAAHPAPRPFALWRDQRALVRGLLHGHGLPADGVILIGDAPFEREWCEAARLAAYVPQERFFAGNGAA